MVGTSSSSSSSSCASFGSLDDGIVKATVKFLCSYGGRILPRYPDGKLRYAGGDTRVLAVDRTVPFSELQVKLKELCGWETVSLRCQLPTEDLDDALVSVTSDEDLANLYEEYDLATRDRILPLKIRAFIFPHPSKTPKGNPTPTVVHRCVQHQISAHTRFSARPAGYPHQHGHHPGAGHGSSRPQQYLVHHGKH